MVKDYSEFEATLSDHIDLSNEQQMELKSAYEFGVTAHAGQTRASGESYFHAHCLPVALHLAEIGMGPNMIMAGMLHDTIEDTPVTNEDVAQNFNADVAFLVEGVSKLGKLKYRGNERHVESLRKFFVAVAEDVRVVILKLCDRWHNLETLEHLRPEKRQRIAEESMLIHGTLASRLNMGKLTNIINDLAFPYAMPEEYQKTKAVRENFLSREDQVIEDMYRGTLHILTETLSYTPVVDRRKKGLYSFYKKLERNDWNTEKIFDMMAIRAIVHTEAECYQALGAVHAKWRPVPGRVKDYIASPKPNGYQSLHTSVFTGRGSVLEVQIRTQAMHDQAEFGVAAHHSYKQDGGQTAAGKFDWIQELSQVSRAEDETPDEYLKELSTDFFQDRIFAMTPEGDVIDMPRGATVLDFAFAVHTEIGTHAKGAKVNGIYKSLNTKLASEDIVEVDTNKKTTPSKEWIEWSVTNLAHATIRRELQSQKELM